MTCDVKAFQEGLKETEEYKKWLLRNFDNSDLCKPCEATKYDDNKLRMELIPVSTLKALAEVLTFGSKKYGDNNWRKGMQWNRLYGACLRHLTAWWGGETNDIESGLNHLQHALCCIAFLIEYTETHPELDNR